MDTKTARYVLMTQADVTVTDSFLGRLKQHQPPVPGQVTSLLLALNTLRQDLKTAQTLDRTLVYALHQLAYESRQCYEQGKQARVEWPPILDADIERIAIATAQIFKGEPA
ncbi:Dethiobiotin synthetase [Leptolyngbya cf. ectocarpi LEGE 11479]|uniref:Dethiobiotin synthetase n=1 Tax=Leptolyngbya cf. ectocarpi LEGE 11479 TaxID=1828722 RepID=A0A928WZJ7_LEPEC|nr:Dethiobiotin synthetase [Leptolyngbya ectocarpi]MBE9066279.1 Dethiobiotin synthetase [Leptolyngbya cf. ectocarpi LEGE 11479]